MENNTHHICLIDCDCGHRMLAFNRAESGSIKRWQIKLWKRKATKERREFIDLSKVTACRRCERIIDVSKPDESYRDDGIELRRVG